MYQVPVALCSGQTPQAGSLALGLCCSSLRLENLLGRQVRSSGRPEYWKRRGKGEVAEVLPELDTRSNNLFPALRSMLSRSQHPCLPSESHLGPSFLCGPKDEISKPGVGDEVRVLLADGFPIQQISDSVDSFLYTLTSAHSTIH